MQSDLASLIVAVFKKNSVEYTWPICSLQFTVEKSLISSDSQRLIEIAFVGQLQTLTKSGTPEKNFGECNRNLEATNIK